VNARHHTRAALTTTQTTAPRQVLIDAFGILFDKLCFIFVQDGHAVLSADSDQKLPICDFLQHASKVKTTFCAGKQEGQEPSASAQSTASKLNQQVSSQRADFIASHTPTSLNKAHKVSRAKK